MKEIVYNADGTSFEREIEAPTGVEQDVYGNELEECLQYLRDTDYIANKLAEAESEYIETGDNTEVLALRQHYVNELATRKIKRERIRELENLLKVE